MSVSVIFVFILFPVYLPLNFDVLQEMSAEDALIYRQSQASGIIYHTALERFMDRNYSNSRVLFEHISGYRDSQDYIAAIIFLQAAGIIDDDPGRAVEMLISIKDYNQEIAKSAYEILYNRALDLMSANHHSRAADIFEEIVGYKDSAEMLDICYLHINNWQALLAFNNGDTDTAYSIFIELGDFGRSERYIAYIEAGRYAEQENYRAAIELYRTLSRRNFLDSLELYRKYGYIYYVEILGRSIYIDNKYHSYEILNLTEQNIIDLIENISGDIPVYFFTDSIEKARYVMYFTHTSRYFGTYNDGTDAYETTITVMITDTEADEILLSEKFTAHPPSAGYLPEGDVYGYFDFFETNDGGLSAYDRYIRPVLMKLFE
jgi:hypothetical protein